MKNFDHNSSEYLEIDGAKVYYETHGDEGSAALLFLHGGFGTMEGFNIVIPKLEKNRRR